MNLYLGGARLPRNEIETALRRLMQFEEREKGAARSLSNKSSQNGTTMCDCGEPEAGVAGERKAGHSTAQGGPQRSGWRARVSVKDELQVAVEDLSDQEAAEVLLVVRRMRAIASWDVAPADDEEEETAEDRVLLVEARAEAAAGHTIPWSDIKRKLRERHT